jgi:predicted transcriptional regulator
VIHPVDDGKREQVVVKQDENRVLDKLLSSDVKLDILALYHADPGLRDAVQGVARRIGRSASEVEKEVKDLLDVGFLESNSEGISLNVKRDMEIQELISNRLRRGA